MAATRPWHRFLGATLLRCRVGALVLIQVRLAEISIDVCSPSKPLYPHAPARAFFYMDKVQDPPSDRSRAVLLCQLSVLAPASDPIGGERLRHEAF